MAKPQAANTFLLEFLSMARASKKPAGRSLYSVHPGVAMVQKWVALVKESGPTDEKACRAWLKEARGRS